MAMKVTKLSISLPFELGKVEFEPNETEKRAAWCLYVELKTRVALVPFNSDKGILRETLNSLYSIFSITRDVLRDAGPAVATGPGSLGVISIDILNVGLRPFTTKWHPSLLAFEQKRPIDVDAFTYEQGWTHAQDMRRELIYLQEQMDLYVDALAQIAGVK